MEHRIWETKYLLIYWSFLSFFGLFVIFLRLELDKNISWYFLFLLIVAIVLLGNYVIWKLDRKNN